MGARCIICKGNFNRSTALDKLRCPSCTDDAETPKSEWAKKLKEVTKKNKKKEKSNG